MELTRTLRELEQLNRRGDAKVKQATCSGPACAESNMGLEYKPGARVFDSVTGQEGVILAGQSENTVV